MPLGERLMRPSASAVDTKNRGCCSMNAVCLSESFENCLAIGVRSEAIAFYALKEVTIAYWVKFGEFCNFRLCHPFDGRLSQGLLRGSLFEH